MIVRLSTLLYSDRCEYQRVRFCRPVKFALDLMRAGSKSFSSPLQPRLMVGPLKIRLLQPYTFEANCSTDYYRRGRITARKTTRHNCGLGEDEQRIDAFMFTHYLLRRLLRYTDCLSVSSWQSSPSQTLEIACQS